MAGTGSNYIYYLEGHSNTLVGVTQGIQGLCIPLGSFPGGYLADRTRRDIVLRAFGVIGFGKPLHCAHGLRQLTQCAISCI